MLIQARYLQREDFVRDLLCLMQKAGMPTTLAGVGVTGDVAALAVHSPVPRYYLHGESDVPVLIKLMKDC